MKEISKKEEQRIIEALEAAVKLANTGVAPDDALVKVAQDYQFPPEIVKRMASAYNTSKTLSHLKNASDDERGGSFPIASPEVILGKLFPTEPETEVKKASAMLHPDYISDDNANFRSMTKEAEVIELPAMTEKKAEPYAPDSLVAAKKVMANHEKLYGLAKRADDAFRHVYFKFLGELDKTASYWRRTTPVEPFEMVEKRAVARFGDSARTLMDMVYGHGKLDDVRLHVKRASADELGTQQMHFDQTAEPYNHVDGLMFLTGEMNRIRKEAAEIRSVMDDHAVSNIHLMPPQPVYDAIDRFLKSAKKDMPAFTAQDRPKKVKEIYKAIKREHPEYSAGKKARIASSSGTGDSKSAALDQLFTK